MILCDAGPLVALVNPAESALHARCAEVLNEVSAPLITTWACLTEAFYLAGRIGGWSAQELLWKLASDPRILQVQVPSPGIMSRSRELMERYQNVPMDFADASLVVTAEERNLRRIFTLDSDFRIYRTRDGGSFEIVP